MSGPVDIEILQGTEGDWFAKVVSDQPSGKRWLSLSGYNGRASYEEAVADANEFARGIVPVAERWLRGHGG